MSGQDARDVAVQVYERLPRSLATDVDVDDLVTIIDALTAAGFAVVKLPEPIHRCDRDVAWLSRDDEIQVDYDSRGSSICVSYPDGSDIPIYGPWDADRALDVGTALIAAHAEAGEDRG